jgi:Lar family restriction alleviation protein
MTEPLKPCPFCGGDDIAVFSLKLLNSTCSQTFSARCEICFVKTIDYTRLEFVLQAWNRRADA